MASNDSPPSSPEGVLPDTPKGWQSFIREHAGMNLFEPPPPSKRPHPESHPKEPERREAEQCQTCFTPKAGPGVTLRKCTGCMIAVYCSRECQVRGWPMHKEKCKMNQRIREQLGEEGRGELDLLRAYTTKHRPTLYDAGCRALDLCVDPTRCLRDLIVVMLKRRPESKRPETYFYPTSAVILDAGSFNPMNRDELLGQLRQSNSPGLKPEGMVGVYYVIMCVEETMVMNVVPVAFAQEQLDEITPGMPWRDTLLSRMTEGIVL